MANASNTQVIDIGKPSGALGRLRLVDYVLLWLCGSAAVRALVNLPIVLLSGSVSEILTSFLFFTFFSFFAYTGWRHVGVIDPTVWRVHRITLPLLAGFALLGTLAMFINSESVATHSDHYKELLIEFSKTATFFWIGFVALIGWVAIRQLRRTKITGFDRPIDQILFRLAKAANTEGMPAADINRISKPRGLGLGFCGTILLVAVNVLQMSGNRLILEFFIQSGAGIENLACVLLCRARRYFQIDADSLLARDRRPPILFLRSFDDDQKKIYDESTKALLDFSLETRLANHFSHFGPFVAIGSPAETMPQPGAARAFLSDDDWRPRVVRWIEESQLIIMYMGKTRWVNWELRKVLENGCITRLILLMPEIKPEMKFWRAAQRNQEASARGEQLRGIFEGTPWEKEILQIDDFVDVRAVLFRPDGQMVVVRSRSRNRDSWHLAALLGHQILVGTDTTRSNENTSPSTVELAEHGTYRLGRRIRTLFTSWNTLRGWLA